MKKYKLVDEASEVIEITTTESTKRHITLSDLMHRQGKLEDALSEVEDELANAIALLVPEEE